MVYFVATPIGNLDEISLRALDVLKSVDLIAAEDTRHTAILLKKYDIKTPLVSYHKFNERETADGLLQKLEAGSDIAVVSDAGMPAVSDPGHVLIDLAIERGADFTVVSGACAAVNAVVLSGLSSRAFAVLGFLPEKKLDRARFVKPYVGMPCTLVFYSAVHDIDADLEFLYETLGARKCAVCREMTKMFETVTRGTLGNMPEIVKKGEFAVVVEGASGESELNKLSVEEHIEHYLKLGHDVKSAVKLVANDRHVAKSEIYKISVNMKNAQNR